MRTGIHGRQCGASLVELIITLTIVAIALGIGMPSFSATYANAQMTASRNQLITALAQARSTAVMRGSHVVMCPAIDNACMSSVYWHGGWMTFDDRNRNGVREPDETQIAADPGTGKIHIVSSAGRRHIRYLPDGSSEGSNVTLTLCDRRGAAHATALVISNAGRVRAISVTPAYVALACSG